MHICMYKMAVDMSFSQEHNQMGTASDHSATECPRGLLCPRFNLLFICDFMTQLQNIAFDNTSFVIIRVV